MNNKNFACLGLRNDGGRCRITADGRPACGFCRKRKCFEAGMIIPQSSQKRRSPVSRTRDGTKASLVMERKPGSTNLSESRRKPVSFWNSEPWVALRVASTAAHVGLDIRGKSLGEQPAGPVWRMEPLNLELIREKASDLLERPSDWQSTLIPRDFISAADERRLTLVHWPVLLILNMHFLLKKWSIAEAQTTCDGLKQVEGALALVRGMCHSDLEVSFAIALAFLRPGTIGLRHPEKVEIVRKNVWMVMKTHCQAEIFINLLDGSTGNRVQQLLLELDRLDVKMLKLAILGGSASTDVKAIIKSRMKKN